VVLALARLVLALDDRCLAAIGSCAEILSMEAFSIVLASKVETVNKHEKTVSPAPHGASSRIKKLRIRLIHKFAENIDGIDLSRRSVGETFAICADEARLLIAEQWAVLANS